MFGRLTGLARCAVGKHERSVARARRIGDGEQFESVCEHCGVRMVRLAKRNWIVQPRR